MNEARQLSSDVALLRDQYTKASARLAELEQQSQSSESGLTILGSATAPDKPAFPNWPLIVFGSIALGLVLGVLIALLMELMGRKVRGPEDLRIPGVPLLGILTTPAARPSSFAPSFRHRLFRRFRPAGA